MKICLGTRLTVYGPPGVQAGPIDTTGPWAHSWAQTPAAKRNQTQSDAERPVVLLKKSGQTQPHAAIRRSVARTRKPVGPYGSRGLIFGALPRSSIRSPRVAACQQLARFASNPSLSVAADDVEDWTEDGTITFYEIAGGPPDLWMMPAEGGGEPQPFLVTEWSELRLAVSPDGQWASYQSNETGQPEVYVRAFPSGEGQRRVSTGGGAVPRWSPDGETIFFVRNSPVVDTIFAARVQLEPSLLVRETGVVYTTPQIARFDVHPDGTHLIVEVTQPQVASADDESSAPSKVVVVLNWFEELRERLGN